MRRDTAWKCNAQSKAGGWDMGLNKPQVQNRKETKKALFRMNQIAVFFASEVSQGMVCRTQISLASSPITDRPLEPSEEGESESSG